MLFKNLSYKGFKALSVFFILISVSCAENRKENREEQVASTKPLFDLYFRQVHQVELNKNAVIVVLQNNCKPCSFESVKFTDWVCDSVKTEFEKHVLIFAKSDLSLKCNNIVKDSVGYYHSYGLYSFYDKVYVVEDSKLIYQNDIISENIISIKEFLKK